MYTKRRARGNPARSNPAGGVSSDDDGNAAAKAPRKQRRQLRDVVVGGPLGEVPSLHGGSVGVTVGAARAPVDLLRHLGQLLQLAAERMVVAVLRQPLYRRAVLARWCSRSRVE